MYNTLRESVDDFNDLANDISTDAASIRRTIKQANRQSIKLDMALLWLELNVFQFLTLLGHCHCPSRQKQITNLPRHLTPSTKLLFSHNH